MPDTALVPLAKAQRLLAEAKTIEEILRIENLAQRARDFAKAAKLSRETYYQAAKLNLDARRKAGETLLAMRERGELADKGRPEKMLQAQTFITLSDLGLKRNQARRYVIESQVPHDQYQRWVQDCIARDKDLTAAGLRSLSRNAARAASIDDRASKEPASYGIHPGVEIRRGDFREVLADIADASVDLILTDPPYGKRYLELWSELGRFAARVLKPAGALVSYAGQLCLPEILQRLCNHVQWWWMCAVVHCGPGKLTPLDQPVRKVINKFKPVLLFVPANSPGLPCVFEDLITGAGPSKQYHNWEQPVAEAAQLIERFCPPGGLVVDPFAGSGAFGAAAKITGRRFIGAEILDVLEGDPRQSIA